MAPLTLLNRVKDETTPDLVNLANEIDQMSRMISFINSGTLTTFFKPFVDYENAQHESPDESFTDYLYCFTSRGTYFLNICMHKLDSFKEPRLVALLEAYDELGPVEQKTTDTPAYYRREFEFLYKIDDQMSVKVTFDAQVKADSEHCQRIQIGMTPAEPKPIYKLICDSQGDFNA